MVGPSAAYQYIDQLLGLAFPLGIEYVQVSFNLNFPSVYSVVYLSLFMALAGLSFPTPAAAAPPTEAILAEGLKLYQSERAAWVATDLMLATTIDRDQIGGYLTYFRGDSVCTFFWAKESTGDAGAPLIGSYVFPSQDVRLETSHFRPVGAFTPTEARLFAVRRAALAVLNADHAEFPVPDNTSLNLDLLDGPAGTRVYVLTGPQQGGIVPFGNDHLLTFDTAGRLTATEHLHSTYLPMSQSIEQKEIKEMFHTHLPAHPYITATDICNSLLYQPPGCTQLVVMSQDYVSFFNLEKKQLLILTRKAYERIAKSQAATH